MKNYCVVYEGDWQDIRAEKFVQMGDSVVFTVGQEVVALVPMAQLKMVVIRENMVAKR